MGNLCCNDTIVLSASRRPNVCYMGMIIDIVLKLGQVDHAVFAFSQQKEDFGKKGDCFMGICRDCFWWPNRPSMGSNLNSVCRRSNLMNYEPTELWVRPCPQRGPGDN